MAANIPVVKLKRLLDSLIEYIRSDLETNIAAGTEDESFLYRILYGNNTDGYDFYEEGKHIFSRESTSSRRIETRLMFTKDLAPTPTIHVREPAKTKGGFNTIGGLSPDRLSYENEDYTYSDQYRVSSKGVYEFVCTADNPLEVILISEVIESALIAAWETLNDLEFALFDFGTKELMANHELIAYPMFIKSIEVTIEYENTIPSIQKETLCASLEFEKPSIESN